MAEPTADDKALTAHFLRGMRRFQTYLAQKDMEITLEEVNRRIEIAYFRAVAQFTAQDEKENR